MGYDNNKGTDILEFEYTLYVYYVRRLKFSRISLKLVSWYIIKV